jgi:hypothetical protein
MLESDVVSSLAGNHWKAYDWRILPKPAFRSATSDIDVRAPQRRPELWWNATFRFLPNLKFNQQIPEHDQGHSVDS